MVRRPLIDGYSVLDVPAHIPALFYATTALYSVYNFGKQCGWKVHLLKLPSDAILEEARQKLADKSRKQLEWSKKERRNRIRGIAEVRASRQAIAKQDTEQTEAHRIHRLDHIDVIFREKAEALAKTIETRSTQGQNQEWLVDIYGPQSYWGKRIANAEFEEAKRKEEQEKALSPRDGVVSVETINEKGEKTIDFRCLGGKLMSSLEEKRILAQTVEIESKASWKLVHSKKHIYPCQQPGFLT